MEPALRTPLSGFLETTGLASLKPLEKIRNLAAVLLPPLITIGFLLLLWQLLCGHDGSSLPPPSKVLKDPWDLLRDRFFDTGVFVGVVGIDVHVGPQRTRSQGIQAITPTGIFALSREAEEDIVFSGGHGIGHDPQSIVDRLARTTGPGIVRSLPFYNDVAP